MLTSRRRFLAMAGGTALGVVAAPRLLRLDATAVHAQAIPGAQTFEGAAGKSYLGPIPLAAGVTVLRVQHNGTANFVVNTYIPNDGFSPQDAFDQAQTTDNSLVYDIIGADKGGSVVLTQYNANYYMYVEASGAWQISIEQPLPENVVPTQATSFRSKGQDITPYFLLPDGITQISLQAPANSALHGYLYHIDDLGGEAVQGGDNGYQSRFFDFTNPTESGSYPISLPDDGPYIFFVTNDVTDTTPWTVSFA
jgi:hypothetical protein